MNETIMTIDMLGAMLFNHLRYPFTPRTENLDEKAIQLCKLLADAEGEIDQERYERLGKLASEYLDKYSIEF